MQRNSKIHPGEPQTFLGGGEIFGRKEGKNDHLVSHLIQHFMLISIGKGKFFVKINISARNDRFRGIFLPKNREKMGKFPSFSKIDHLAYHLKDSFMLINVCLRHLM